MHDSLAFLKSCESMAFLVRDVAHVTPLNFGRCVQVNVVSVAEDILLWDRIHNTCEYGPTVSYKEQHMFFITYEWV